MTSSRVATACVAVVLAVALANLPLDGFFTGDSGVKLIAARHAVDHPERPFDVTPPIVAGAAAPAFVEPFFQAHGDHLHAATSQVFPVLAAPFVAIAGVRGAYLLPALALLVLVPVTISWARRLGIQGPPALAGWAAALASPLAFYALEVWEHAPAVACIATAGMLAVPGRPGRTGAASAGVLMALAILFRPEAGWSAAALGAVLAFSPDRRSRVPWFALGVAAGLAPLAAYNAAHFGSVWGPHVAGNVGAYEQDWLATRLAIVRLWFLSWNGRDSLWAAFPIAVLAFLAPARSAGVRALWTLVLVPAIGIVLTAPNTGGAQWGPRYLLVVVPPLLLLAQDAGYRLARRPGVPGTLLTAVVAAAIVAGLATTRAAYRYQRGAKRLHADVARGIGALGEPYVVTDLWWLDQLAAAASPQPTFLFVRNRADLDDVVARFDRGGVRRFAIARSPESAAATWIGMPPPGYAPRTTRTIPVRDIQIAQYVRAR